jgi:hypothetical protein
MDCESYPAARLQMFLNVKDVIHTLQSDSKQFTTLSPAQILTNSAKNVCAKDVTE